MNYNKHTFQSIAHKARESSKGKHTWGKTQMSNGKQTPKSSQGANNNIDINPLCSREETQEVGLKVGELS